MTRVHRITLSVPLAAPLILFLIGGTTTAVGQQPSPLENVARKIGTVEAINGSTVTLKTDSGPEANIVIQQSTRLAQLPAGETDLKAATPIQLSDIQPGDRMLARGSASTDGQSVVAQTVILMKKADLAQKQQRDREDWQRRGIGGIVSAADPATGTLNISITPTYKMAIKTSPNTVFLRYAPDSVKFSDARRGTLDQIKAGDQLRARGNRSTNGKEMTAEEIVSGSFRNIAGTVISVESAANTIKVMDLITKNPVVIKVTQDSQLRKLTPQMAQGLAILIRGVPGPNPGTAPDLQKLLGTVPAIALSDMRQGDVLMIVSTQGAPGGPVTAITLLAGVEPVLNAAASPGGAATLLSGWNMSASMGEASH